jgi:hypothetical protein
MRRWLCGWLVCVTLPAATALYSIIFKKTLDEENSMLRVLSLYSQHIHYQLLTTTHVELVN